MKCSVKSAMFDGCHTWYSEQCEDRGENREGKCERTVGERYVPCVGIREEDGKVPYADLRL